MMSAAIGMPEHAAPPPKASGADTNSLSQRLAQALRDDALQDPDLGHAINERRRLTTGKHAKSFCAGPKALAMSDELCADSPEEHDRSYFALLAKIAKLEAENGRLFVDLACCREDALVYEEVAHELEHDLNVATAVSTKDQATIAMLKATMCAREAEEPIASLRAQLAVGPHAEATCAQETAVVSSSHEDRIVASPQALDLLTSAMATSAAESSSDTEDTAVSETPAHKRASDLTCSRLRMHTQRAAVEYRRAVREHLQQSLRHESFQALRSSLPDLYTTPPEMLDDEVLSEDEEESDLCVSRRKMGWEFRSISPRSVCGFQI